MGELIKISKERKLITLSREVIEDIERKIKNDPDFNFSAWVEYRWLEEEMTEKALMIKQKFYENLAKKFKNRVYYSAKKNGKLAEKLSEKQKKHLLSSKRIISKKAYFFEGQLRVWNNAFQDLKLTGSQFKELLSLDFKKQ